MGPPIVNIDFRRAVSTFKRNVSLNSEDFSCCDFPQIDGFGVIGLSLPSLPEAARQRHIPTLRVIRLAPDYCETCEPVLWPWPQKENADLLYLEHRAIEA